MSPHLYASRESKHIRSLGVSPFIFHYPCHLSFLGLLQWLLLNDLLTTCHSRVRRFACDSSPQNTDAGIDLDGKVTDSVTKETYIRGVTGNLSRARMKLPFYRLRRREGRPLLRFHNGWWASSNFLGSVTTYKLVRGRRPLSLFAGQVSRPDSVAAVLLVAGASSPHQFYATLSQDASSQVLLGPSSSTTLTSQEALCQ
jgi:hypothetical protein